MRQVAPGVHVAERELRFLGIEVGTRMTVLETSDGLLVHSPIDVDPSTLDPIGRPRWVVAPNLLHHLFVGPWVAAGLEGWAAPGLPRKRPDVAFTGVLARGAAPFGDEVVMVPLTCFGLSNEVVLFHRPSRTLVVTDLVFNLPPTMPLLTRAVMWCACAYPGCRASLLERVGMKRAIARREIAEIAALDFDRVVMSHGEVIETGGKSAFREAYGWLGVDWEAARGA